MVRSGSGRLVGAQDEIGRIYTAATWLVSRELAQAAGPWDTRLLGDDDGEYFCRVLLASDGVRFVPESKVYYRRSGVNCLSYIGLSDKKMEAQMCSMHCTFAISVGSKIARG